MKTGSDKLYARNSATSRFYFPTRTRTMRERSALIDVLIDVASFLPSFFLPFLSFFFFFYTTPLVDAQRGRIHCSVDWYDYVYGAKGTRYA